MKPRCRQRRTTFSIRSFSPWGASGLAWDSSVIGADYRSVILVVTSLASSRPRTVSTARPSRRSTSPSSSSARARASQGTPARRAQRERERLEGPLLGGEHLAAGLGRATGRDGVDVALGRADVPPAHPVAVAVGGRADAHVVALLPVELVVPAPVPGPGPVGDLLPAVPGPGEDLVGQLVAAGQRVVVGMAVGRAGPAGVPGSTVRA